MIVSLQDVDNAINIYGVPEPLLYCRTVGPKQVSHREKTIDIPSQIYDIHKHLHLFIDICYINKMIFMVTISCNIQYITIDPLENKTKGHIIKTLNKI